RLATDDRARRHAHPRGGRAHRAPRCGSTQERSGHAAPARGRRAHPQPRDRRRRRGQRRRAVHRDHRRACRGRAPASRARPASGDDAAKRVGGDYTLAIIAVENDLSSARRSADRKPPDVDAARDRLTHAQAKLDEAARSPIADQAKVAALRDELAKIDDDITGVVVDLARVLPGAKPAAIVGNLNGLYVTDPGVGRLWPILRAPPPTGRVLAQG